MLSEPWSGKHGIQNGTQCNKLEMFVVKKTHQTYSVPNAEDTKQPPQSPIPQVSNHSVFTCKDNVHHLLVPCSAVSIARS